MKKFIIPLVLFFLLSTVYGGEIKKVFKAESGGELEVDIKIGGSITVTGWDENSVEVLARFRGNELDEYIWLEIDETSNGVSVSAGSDGHSRSSKLEFKIKVPKKYDIELNTMGGGLYVSNLEGDLEGETMGGGIELNKLKGEVDFSTMGGSIELSDSEVDGKVSTMGGKVSFENIIGDVSGSSMGGDVIYRNVRSREGNSEGGEVKIKTMGGDIKVDEALYGANVTTMGGDIEVNKVVKYLKASTMGGDIDVKEIDGKIKASTMGGDVYVTMTGNPDEYDREVELSSMGGDIELTLPDGISATLDIRVTYTRNSSKRYKIISDFPLDIEGDKDWSYGDGDPRKTIDGKGKTGSGKHRVKVSTVNGDIIIRKK